jgi:hypothetical protein
MRRRRGNMMPIGKVIIALDSEANEDLVALDDNEELISEASEILISAILWEEFSDEDLDEEAGLELNQEEKISLLLLLYLLKNHFSE